MRYQTSNYALLKELLKSVPEGDACMEWPRGKVAFGYGQIKFKDRCVAIHRVAYELAVGPIPGKLFVLHSCDNPACFRPSHLFLGTKLENSRDCTAKGRQIRCHGEAVNTAKLSEEKVREIRALHAEGWTQRRLVEKFGIGQTTISRIILRQYWKHVNP